MSENKDNEGKEEKKLDLTVIKTYDYWGNIKTAGCANGSSTEDGTCMGLQDSKSDAALTNTRIAIESYMKELNYGYYNPKGGVHSATRANGGKGGPMGNRYFFATGGKCNDGEKQQDRYRYMNNIPHSKRGVNRGLVPGMIGNIEKLNPFNIVRAFTEETNPKCQERELEVVDGKNSEKKYEKRYITDADIKNLDPCVFKPSDGIHKNPISGGKGRTVKECRNEVGFTNMFVDKYTSSHKKIQTHNTPHANLPDDPLTNIYIFTLSLFGIYIVKKFTEKI